jgi:flagellar M-ring protein FliF
MQDAMLTRAKEATLMQIMREWPDVREARVMINSVIKRGFGDAAAAPSASVNLRMKRPGGKADKRLIAAAADTLAGVVSGLNRSKVSVVIDGAPYSVADHGSDAGAAGGGSDSFIEMVKEGERYYSEKIEARLARYGGAMVSVTVDPKMTSSQIEKETYDKSKTFLQPLSVDEKTEENVTSSGRAPAEPGVVPNTGANRPSDVSGGGGGGSEASNNNSTDTKTKNQIFPSVIRERLMNPAGTAAVVGASVSIPRSYLVRIFKAQSSSNKEPDEAALQPLVDSELRKVKNAVLGCVSQIPEDKILLDYYYDDLPMLEAAGQPAMASSVPLALTGHIKEIALGALAIISLFMVSMMVRKSSPAPIIAPKADRASVPLTVSAEDSATEVSEGIQSMDGMEVDEDSIRTQQMIGQVSNMVKENPDGAANLVKRWLNRA